MALIHSVPIYHTGVHRTAANMTEKAADQYKNFPEVDLKDSASTVEFCENRKKYKWAFLRWPLLCWAILILQVVTILIITGLSVWLIELRHQSSSDVKTRGEPTELRSPSVHSALASTTPATTNLQIPAPPMAPATVEPMVRPHRRVHIVRVLNLGVPQPRTVNVGSWVMQPAPIPDQTSQELKDKREDDKAGHNPGASENFQERNISAQKEGGRKRFIAMFRFPKAASNDNSSSGNTVSSGSEKQSEAATPTSISKPTTETKATSIFEKIWNGIQDRRRALMKYFRNFGRQPSKSALNKTNNIGQLDEEKDIDNEIIDK